LLHIGWFGSDGAKLNVENSSLEAHFLDTQYEISSGCGATPCADTACAGTRAVGEKPLWPVTVIAHRALDVLDFNAAQELEISRGARSTARVK
jgi:hypothetical protein